MRENIDGTWNISIHALREESDTGHVNMSDGAIIFQSTLSVRRATCYNLKNTDNSIHISIHALREESDSSSRPSK